MSRKGIRGTFAGKWGDSAKPGAVRGKKEQQCCLKPKQQMKNTFEIRHRYVIYKKLTSPAKKMLRILRQYANSFYPASHMQARSYPCGSCPKTQIIPRLLTTEFVLVIHQESEEETLSPVSWPLVSWNSHCVCSSKQISSSSLITPAPVARTWRMLR
jgi:hypothetical protein